MLGIVKPSCFAVFPGLDHITADILQCKYVSVLFCKEYLDMRMSWTSLKWVRSYEDYFS